MDSQSSIANPDDLYKYSGKEYDTETGYSYFGARSYDGRIGRWMTVDPLADKYPGWSPYNYVMGNPLRLVDPDGMRVNDGDEEDKEQNKKNLLQALSDALYELKMAVTGGVEGESGGIEIPNQTEVKKIVSSGTTVKDVKKKAGESAYKGLEDVEDYSAETSRLAGGIALLTVWAPPVSGAFFTLSNISGNISMTAGVLKYVISPTTQNGNAALSDLAFFAGGQLIDTKIHTAKFLSISEKELTKRTLGSSYNVLNSFLGF